MKVTDFEVDGPCRKMMSNDLTDLNTPLE